MMEAGEDSETQNCIQNDTNDFRRSEVLTAVNANIAISGTVTPCSLVYRYENFTS
jgi:hypothetical protein